MGKKLKKQPITDIFGFILGYEAPEKHIRIVRCEKTEADRIIIENHYSHKVTQNSFLSFLVYYEGSIEGAIQLGYGIKPKENKNNGDMTPENTREFDRMWLSDNMPKFSETIVIALLHKTLRQMCPNIKYLISYADQSAGMTGTIYKAANYEFVGKHKSAFWLLPNGERLHPITCWHRHKTQATETMEKLYPGVKRAEGWQLKFIKKLF